MGKTWHFVHLLFRYSTNGFSRKPDLRLHWTNSQRFFHLSSQEYATLALPFLHSFSFNHFFAGLKRSIIASPCLRQSKHLSAPFSFIKRLLSFFTTMASFSGARVSSENSSPLHRPLQLLFLLAWQPRSCLSRCSSQNSWLNIPLFEWTWKRQLWRPV